MTSHKLTFALALSAASLSASPSAAQGEWPIYVNGRFGFQICYPADLLKPQGEADNGDGQVFIARDGAELRVYGTNNLEGQTLAQQADEEARTYTSQSGKITYRATKQGWIVLSGDNGASTDFYAKTFQRGDQFVAFELKYPKAASQRYKPVVMRLSSCFKLGKAAF